MTNLQPFRLACAACLRQIALGADVHLVDDEWLRRHPRKMVGRILCLRCANEYQDSCTRPDGEYLRGHQGVRFPAEMVVPESQVRRLAERADFDRWSHLLMSATQRAAVLCDPVSGAAQGAVEYLRTVAAGPKVDPMIRHGVLAALARESTRRRGVRA